MNRLSHTRVNAWLAIRCKAGLFHAYFIHAHSQLLCAKETLLIGFHRANLTRQSIPYHKLRAGDCGTAAIPHSTLKCRSNSRSLSGSVGCAEQQGKRDSNPDNNVTHGKQTVIHHLGEPIPTNGRRTRKV